MEKDKKVTPGIVYTDKENPPNQRTYLVLLKGEYVDDDREEFRDFEWVIGRQNVYEFLRDFILNEEGISINIHTSLVISETVRILDAISVYTFMKHFKGIVVDETGFDIEEYNIDDGAFLDEEPEA